MITPANLSGKLAIDVQGVGELRQAARDNSPEAVKAAAKQFEAIFMHMIMKSMREASPQDGIFDNDQSRMYTSMLDQQISQNLASKGVGLADVLIRQLSGTVGTHMPAQLPVQTVMPPVSDRSAGLARTPMPSPAFVPAMAVEPASDAGKSSAAQPPHVKAFQDRLGAHAEEASRTTGIPARFMLGQAALETGWGKREIKGADGTPSHNLFGIKATGGWKGKVVETATTEYINGVPQTRIEKFRAYDSYADAFRDYGKLLSNNPRYEGVLANAGSAAGFAQGLQKAGYATDPNYAAKLTRIIKQTLST